jgi:putative ABC transport system permease protein
LESPNLQEPLKVNRFQGDFDYISTLSFQLVQGRDFSKDIASDSDAVILNESAVKALQLEKPVGTILNREYEVIGVVRDFNFESLKKEIAPAMITAGGEAGYELAVRLEGGKASEFLDFVQAEWAKLSPDAPISYHFLDENFEKMMRNEKIIGKVVAIFTAFAIAVSCLGLFGLSAYMASQRRKEIGIRKVLGASIGDVLIMFNRQYTILIVVAIGIAIPASLYLMTNWLSTFAYRTTIDFWVIAGTCAMTLLISWLTVSYHTFKASTINPAETLKYE